MSYVNPRHRGRLIVIDVIKDAFAEVLVLGAPTGAEPVSLDGTDLPLFLNKKIEHLVREPERHLYNFPFLFLSTGVPWIEANSYLLHFVAKSSDKKRPTDNARRRAAKLIDYLLFCEEVGLDWLDFSGARPSSRPTYRYFNFLRTRGDLSAAVVNQYTGVIYDFYSYVSKNWCNLDMGRVDRLTHFNLILNGAYGSKVLRRTKRAQTQATAPTSSVAIGYVRDEGEDLRPLTNKELAEFLRVIQRDDWSVLERLVLFFSLMTGARKQTVLTLRLKHLKRFEGKPDANGTYSIFAGPGTGIDTKNDKPQRLYVPSQLAQELLVYSNSPVAARRRVKFRENWRREHAGLSEFSEDDIYVFLSDQGGCYYMAADDPRYSFVRTPPKGQVTENLKKKLLTHVDSNFPRDFTFHWLRATFAFQLYQRLQPLIASGTMRYGEEISFIQARMHHRCRETTERYLKLFVMHSDKLLAQEAYEEYLLGFEKYSDLSVAEYEA
ncbi:site-specific integrase [Pseudomonas oryzihabitans]|uniref:site-specific integrase n=1 Tax=Pseudomonas oryzihabitans TaxID=47885 RepID=UPI0011A573DF|nr:site-specific integrase [Pseudomonas oryzihabitans]